MKTNSAGALPRFPDPPLSHTITAMPTDTARSTANSEAMFLRARQIMPGGVSSPVRAFKAVGGTPLFIKSGSGCRVTDVDGNSYIDYVASYGPLIAGHAHETVVAAISKAVGRGTTFGAPTEGEVLLAAKIVGAMPWIEMIRFVSSGTEAAMSALRVARAYTKRDMIIKCVGCYHGHADALLVEAGSGALTLGVPSSPGVPKSIVSSTLLAPYNDLDAARKLFETFPNQIACFAVEPIAGNMGVVPPTPDYLKGLRALCDEHGALLLFDEVMTGFRVAWSGAASLYGVKPDLTCLAKVIGGGMPVGAYGGRRDIMEMISPVGPVYQAGTLSGNPVAMAAGLATLELMEEPGAYEQLEATSDRLARGLASAAESAGVPVAINRVGAMIGLFFTRSPGDVVNNFATATACDETAYRRFFHAMLDNGVYLAPSMYEALFPGLAHDDDAIAATLAAAKKAFAAVKAG